MSRKRILDNNGNPFQKKKWKINKHLIYVNKSLSATTQSSTTLFTTTYPCTVMGLRWDGVFMSNSSVSDTFATWCIVVVKDTITESTMSQTDGSNFYRPEQDVLTFGVVVGTDSDGGVGPKGTHINGTVKTKRKLQTGDTLEFLIKPTSTNGCSIDVICQFFLMV